MLWADHEGRFRGATKLKGIKNFAAKDYGLVPIRLDTWGQFVFILADLTRCALTPPTCVSLSNHLMHSCKALVHFIVPSRTKLHHGSSNVLPCGFYACSS